MSKIKQSSPLGEWLKREAKQRGWSMRQVAERTKGMPGRPEGFTNTTISDVANGSATEPKVCRGLAFAFNEPGHPVTEEELMVLAGITIDRGEILPIALVWSDKLRRFNSADRQQLIETIDRVIALAEPLALRNQEDHGAGTALAPSEVEAVG
jgi:transcriptional regulator with XRE-family HTH domain